MREAPSPVDNGIVAARSMICPKCRHQFETMRRFELACPECHFEWEEASVDAYRDSFAGRFEETRGNLLGFAAILIAIGAVVVFIGFFVSILVAILIGPFGRGINDFLVIAGVVVVALGFLMRFPFVRRLPVVGATATGLLNWLMANVHAQPR